MANYMYMDQGDDDPPQILVTIDDKDSKKLKDSDERFKKGEWSNDAICDLLDAYEAKWNNRNRGNLRVGDWEDVSAQVTNRNGGLKAGKTPTQCKNKIEGMKKRYRSEALESCSNNGGNCSAWPFFYRMDLMLRCPTRKAGIPGGMDAGCQSGVDDGIPVIEDGEGSEVRRDVDFDCEHSPVENLGKSLLVLQQHFERDQTLNILPQQFETEQVDKGRASHLCEAAPESDTSPLPIIKIDENENNMGGVGSGKAKLRKQIHNDVAVNIRSFADSILRLEQAKMEMYKDTERLRAEAETRRAELELKRTEIIMDTQLQIAKLLSSKTRKRKANNASQATKRSNVVVDEACVSKIQVAGQPEVQSLQPGNVFLSPEPSLM